MKIAHLADIHIRNTQFHAEYREVFDKLYKSLSKNSPDLIYIGGDLFHSKQILSPESVELATEFLTNLSQIAHVLLIVGNHDVALTSKEQRLDAITPIVSILKSDKITYLKNSGVWEFNDVYFVHYSCIDNLVPDISFIPDGATKAVLYHGIVQGAITHTGKEFEQTEDNRNIQWDTFDMGLLGDIHMVQNVTANIYYPSSLICQDFGEHPTNHGYILWDTEKLDVKPSYIKIPNKNTYYTFHYSRGIVHTNDVVKDFSTVPQTAKLRIFYDPSDKLGDVKLEVRKHFPNNTSIIYRKKQLYNEDKTQVKVKQDIIDLYSKENLVELVDEYTVSESPEIQQSIREMTKRIFEENVEKLESRGNKQGYRLCDISFDNTFAYGDGNRINFRNLSGIIGLSAPNRTGKSSFLNTIPFSIFGNFPRMGKVDNVFNNNENTYSTSVELEMGDSKFFIERTGKRTKKTTSNVLTFKEVTASGEEINHTEDANVTKGKIKDRFGDLDTYLRSAYIYQNSNDLFLNLTPVPRMDWISKNLGTEIFDILNDQAKSESKEQAGKIKEYESRDFITEEIEITKELNNKKDELKVVNDTLTESDEKILQLQQEKNVVESTKLPEPTTSQLSKLRVNEDEILRLQEQSKDITVQIETFSKALDLPTFKESSVYKQHVAKIDDVKSKIQKLQSRSDYDEKIKTYKENVANTLRVGKENSTTFKIKQQEYDDLKSSFDSLDVISQEQYEGQLAELKKYKAILQTFDGDITNAKRNIESLKKDSNFLSTDNRFTTEELCKTCPLLKNAFNATNRINELEVEIAKNEDKVVDYQSKVELLQKQIEESEAYFNKKKEVEETAQKLDILREKRQTLLDRYDNAKKQLRTFEEEYESNLTSKIQILEDQINNLENSEDSLFERYTENIQNKIDANKNKLESNTISIGKMQSENEEIRELQKNIEKNQDKNVTIQQLNDKISELEFSVNDLRERRDTINKAISVCEYKIEQIDKDKTRLQELYSEYEVYDKFITMTSRNELPLSIIRKSLNKMEENINEVLSKVTDFTIELSVEKNSVEAVAVSPTRGRWTTDLLSGMESFIVNLAFRIGMMEIANIPIPNFMVIDEGLSAFDYENSQKIPELFDYLKEIFDFVLVVSHNDYMNDFVDTQLLIDRTNERSKLLYE